MACQDNPVNPEFCFFVKSCMEADFVVLCHLHNDIYEINPEYSLEGVMLKLKLKLFTLEKSRLIGKDPDAAKD